MQEPQINQTIEFSIHDLGISGEGVGKWNGYTIFIDGALPGEVVRGTLFQCNKTYGRAKLEAVLSRSSERVAPICPVYDRCGGCQMMHLNYPGQLEFKHQRVLKALQHIGKITDVEVEPCLPSPENLNYRNKIQVIVSPGQDQKMAIGLYARHSHDVVEVERCFIHCPLGEAVFHEVQVRLKNSFVTPYDEATGTGLLRHILIKTAVHLNECLVVFVTSDDPTSELKAIAEEIIRSLPDVKGVVSNVNRRRGNVILGPEFNGLAGSDHLMEDLDGLLFKVSAASFFQVNPRQAINLYRHAIELAQLKKSETALDVYCGVGTLTLNIAKHVLKVVGVENVPDAIKDAHENAARNGITNVQFKCSDASAFVPKASERVDVVFLNPPRKGCDLQVLKNISKIGPSRIVYISCDPATLARDLALLQEEGYRVAHIQPFDMFPQTAHVETIVLLTCEEFRHCRGSSVCG